VTTHLRPRRNIFDNKKYVEEYRASDVESGLGLDRMKLVALAMLLGSDYTEGISGIGEKQWAQDWSGGLRVGPTREPQALNPRKLMPCNVIMRKVTSC
jgi:hypothetical protein